MLPLVATLSPNAAILILTFGCVLVAVEVNRPGLILPGAVGVLLMLLAVGSLAAKHPSATSVLWVAAFAAVLLLPPARMRQSWFVAAAATAGLVFSLKHLVPSKSGAEVSPWAAVFCGTLFGAGTTVLTRIARRARKNKGLD